jgi:hypothetical protein
MNPLSWFQKGKRTITLSILSGLVAIVLQADYQGLINLMPMLKLVLQFGLTIMLPLIPVYLRKGIESELGKKK